MKKNPNLVLEQERGIYNDIIQADIDDTYANLTLKVQLAMDFAVRGCPNFDYVIKTDDDMYLNFDSITDFVLKQNKNDPFFGGKCVKNQGPNRNKASKYFVGRQFFKNRVYPPFCSGTMYMMSMVIAKSIHKLVILNVEPCKYHNFSPCEQSPFSNLTTNSSSGLSACTMLNIDWLKKNHF